MRTMINSEQPNAPLGVRVDGVLAIMEQIAKIEADESLTIDQRATLLQSIKAQEDATCGSVDAKVEAYVMAIRQREASAAGLKAEMDVLINPTMARILVLQNEARRMEDRLLMLLRPLKKDGKVMAGTDKARITIWEQADARVELSKAFMDSRKTMKLWRSEWKPKKDEIKKRLKAGEKIPGATLESIEKSRRS